MADWMDLWMDGSSAVAMAEERAAWMVVRTDVGLVEWSVSLVVGK